MNSDEIVAAIIRQRKRLGLTQAQLAQRAGISRRTMVAFEAGQHDIGVRKLLRLLDSTGLALAVKEAGSRPVESELRTLFDDGDDDDDA
jgi:transcriptional regulator with XRE-family HTH domain